MGIKNFFSRKKASPVEADPIYIESQLQTITNAKTMPRFNRNIAINAYNGYWASAIDYNAQAAALGMLRLYSRTSKNGTKCLFKTKKNTPNQKDYISCILNHKPSQQVLSKMNDADEDFEIVQGHPLSKLLLAANPMQSTYELFLDIALSMEITGDAFIYVVSNPDGTPQQLYVLQAQYMEIISAKKGSGRLISHYEFKKGAETVVKYAPEDIIHIKYPNPKSIWYGMGKIEKGWQSYLLNKFSHDYQIALYSNNAVPDYLLINKSGNSISKKRFWKSMKSQFRGARNSGGAMAIDGDVDIKTVAFKPKDLTDVTLNIQEIASVSGCPLNKLIGNSQIKANSEQQDAGWYGTTVLNLMKLISSGLTSGLLWRYGIADGDAFLMFDNPVPVNMEQKSKIDETYSKIAVKTPNEIRKSLGLEELGEELDSTYFNGQVLGSTDEEEVVEEDKSIDIRESMKEIAKELAGQKKEQPPITINVV